MIHDNELSEALVISFALISQNESFKLILSDPGCTESGVVEFASIRFLNVRGYSRVNGLMESLNRHVETFELRNTREPLILQSHSVRSLPDGSFADLWFGYSFGRINFFFDDIDISRRRAKGTEVGNNVFTYTDLNTGEPIDFYSPFS